MLLRAELKGDFSSLKSCGKGRNGGACTAAAFLQKFVGKDTAWAHIDIAGPAMYIQLNLCYVLQLILRVQVFSAAGLYAEGCDWVRCSVACRLCASAIDSFTFNGALLQH